MKYTSFEGEKVERHAWLGRHVAFQTAREDLDPAAMTRRATRSTRSTSSITMPPNESRPKLKQYEGRVTITEIEKTCGAGCGYLGATGIELMPGCFQELYEGVLKHGRD